MRVLSVILILIAVACGIGAVVSSRAEFEEGPTTVSIQDLEAGKFPPGKKWLKVTGGELSWTPYYKYTRTSKRTKSESTQGFYVPLVSKQTNAEQTISLFTNAAEKKPTFKSVRLMVFVTEAELKAVNAQWTEQDEEKVTAFEAVGTIEPLTDSSNVMLKNKLSEGTKDLDVAKISVLDVGDTMPGKSASMACLIVAAIGALLGGVALWLLASAQQRKRRAQFAGALQGGPGQYGQAPYGQGQQYPPGQYPQQPYPPAGGPPGAYPGAYPSSPTSYPPGSYPPPGGYGQPPSNPPR